MWKLGLLLMPAAGRMLVLCRAPLVTPVIGLLLELGLAAPMKRL